MEIIDFHTHTFPDAIAGRAVSALAERSGLTPALDGTAGALTASMEAAGIAVSVVLPVATSPEQAHKINVGSAKSNGKSGVFYAGAIHPDCADFEQELDFIKNAGLFGVKLHPDYQGAFFDDERYIRIMAAAAERGLITVTHAGVDLGFPGCVRCTPDRVLNVLGALRGLIDDRLVLAHMGGCDEADEVLEKLAGKPVYMDTAFVLDRYPDRCAEIIRRHGAERILFATDSPWADQREYVSLIASLGLTEGELERICRKNAAALLGLSCWGSGISESEA